MTAITFCAIPKAFGGHTGVIQRNAIRSWLLLAPAPDILLFGDDAGVAAAARQFGVRHVPELARNEYGTPLVSNALQRAQQLATTDLVCYINADIMLLSDFMPAAARVSGWSRAFLLVGQRWDMDVTTPLSFEPGWEQALRGKTKDEGTLHPRTGMDYFLCRVGLWKHVPPFAIGRTAWDNWLVFSARAQGAEVIDATADVMAVHQNHDYAHISTRQGGVWDSKEVRRNAMLAGEGRFFTLDDATHELRAGRIRPALDSRRLWRRIRTWPALRAAGTRAGFEAVVVGT